MYGNFKNVTSTKKNLKLVMGLFLKKSAFRAKTAQQKSAFRATETSRSRVKHATIVLCIVGLRNRPAGAGGLWFALSAYLFLALHGILTLFPAR